MKIVFDASALEGAALTGVERCARHLAEALAREDGVELLALARRRIEFEAPVEFELRRSSLPRSLWRRWHLLPTARAHEAQLVYAPTSIGLSSNHLAIARTVHDLGRQRVALDSASDSNLPSSVQAWLERRRLAELSPTIFPTEVVRREFLQLLPQADSLVTAVIPHGIEPEFFDDDLLPTTLPTGVERPFVLVLGSVRARRRPELLARLFREHRDLPRLVWAGGAPSQLSSDDRIRFLGSVDDRVRRALLDNCEALLMTSTYEGFGLPGLEAMARRRPLIAEDQPVYREVYGPHALYCDFSRVDHLRDQIAVAQGSHENENVRAAGRVHAETFRWSRAARSHLEFFRSLIESVEKQSS